MKPNVITFDPIEASAQADRKHLPPRGWPAFQEARASGAERARIERAACALQVGEEIFHQFSVALFEEVEQ